MNDHTIEMTESAHKDLKEIIRYFRTDLTSPDTALLFLDGIESVTNQFVYMPEKFQRVHDDYLASMGYRSTQYKRYLIFYKIDFNSKTVYIHRKLHSWRNWKYLI